MITGDKYGASRGQPNPRMKTKRRISAGKDERYSCSIVREAFLQDRVRGMLTGHDMWEPSGQTEEDSRWYSCKTRVFWILT